MKRLILTLVLLTLLCVPSFAAVDMDAKVKVDAPYLIRLSENLYLGVDASKGVAEDLLNSGRYWYEDDEAYEAVLKVTYVGTWFGKKK